MFTILGADQKPYGPVTAGQVREWIASNRAGQKTPAKSDTDAEWKTLADFPEFQNLFTASAAPPLLSTPLEPRRKKYSLLLGPVAPMTRDRAWVCLTTNLSLPGFGSIFGRRKIGYAQIFLTMASFGLTTVCGLATIAWFHANSQRLQQTEDGSLGELWEHLRWPFLGFALFGIAFLWALVTSLGLMAEARRNAKAARTVRQ